jgi:Tol biopolymer transport system component
VIAYVALDQNLMPQVCLWEAFESAVAGPLVYGMTNSTDPAWAPDGSMLAFAWAQGGFYHITVVNTTGEVQPLPAGIRGIPP